MDRTSGVPDDVTRPVAALRTALRRDATELPAAALIELHRSGHDVSIVDPAGDAVVYVTRRPGAGLDQLSAREREVAAVVARGLTNRQAAMTLRISVHTVKDHVHAILTKLGLESRAQLAAAWYGERS